MKHALLSLALVLVSPFVFGQTNSNGETENPVTPKDEAGSATTDADDPGNGETENPVTAKIEGPITTTGGAVSAFALDEMIVVKTEEGEAASFALSSTATYQNIAGYDIDASSVKEGTRVEVTAEENGEQKVAIRIVVVN